MGHLSQAWHGPARRLTLHRDQCIYCTEIHIGAYSEKYHIAPGALGANGVTAMPPSYFDLFLAFLGLTFGLPSVLPGLFFQSKDDRRPKS